MSEYRYALARATGVNPGPFAPMYLCAQLARGSLVGTTLEENLEILSAQGIERSVEYSLGVINSLYDYTDQPGMEDRVRAFAYRTSGYVWRYLPHADQQTIDTWMADENLPIMIVLDLRYHNFDYAGHTDGTGVTYPLRIQPPTAGMPFRASHAVMGYRTDAQGVWFLNTWGAAYERDGWAELSWAALAAERYVYVLQRQTRIPSVPSHQVRTVLSPVSKFAPARTL